MLGKSLFRPQDNEKSTIIRFKRKSIQTMKVEELEMPMVRESEQLYLLSVGYDAPPVRKAASKEHRRTEVP